MDALQVKESQRKQAIILRRRMTEESVKSAKEENFKRLSHSAQVSNLQEQGTYGSRC